MAIWPEQVSNEGHVDAALGLELASWTAEELLEDEPDSGMFDVLEESIVEDGT